MVLGLIMPKRDSFQTLADLKGDSETNKVTIVVLSVLGRKVILRKLENWAQKCI